MNGQPPRCRYCGEPMVVIKLYDSFGRLSGRAWRCPEDGYSFDMGQSS